MTRLRHVVLSAAIFAMPALAVGQTPQAPRTEVSGGLRAVAPVPFTAVDARETTVGGGTLTVFETRSTLGTAAGAHVRVGVRVTPAWWVESAIGIDSTTLSTEVTRDRDTGAITVTEPITQYLFEVGAMRRLGRSRPRRVEPFLGAGAGYLRQLHDGQTLVQSGWSGYAGGGLSYRLSGTAVSRNAVGLRFDIRAVLLGESITLDRQLHLAPSFGASVFVRF